jgi:ParB family chromosome partitioning protein
MTMPETQKTPAAAAPVTKAPETTKKAAAKKSKKKIVLPKNLLVKVDRIRLATNWNREKLGDISGLIASMREEGQLVAITVRPTDVSGVFMVIDGHRRLAAARKLGWTTIMVTINKVRDSGKAFLQSMIANVAREANTPYELATSFDKLVKEHKLTNEKIAKACGKSAGYVSQYLAVLKADKKLQLALKKGIVSLAVFRHFARLDQETEAEYYNKMMELAIEGVSAQDVGDKIDKYMDKKVERERKAAVKVGKKSAPKAPKKGAAAHKPKKGAPKLTLPDYRAKAVVESIQMIKKKDAVDWLDTYREKALQATTSRKREYYQGVLEGLEIATGLLKES